MNQKEITIPCGTSVVIRCEAPKNTNIIKRTPAVPPTQANGAVLPTREANNSNASVPPTEAINTSITFNNTKMNNKEKNIVPPTNAEIPGVVPLIPTGPSTPNVAPAKNNNTKNNNTKNNNTKINKTKTNKNKNKNKKNNTTNLIEPTAPPTNNASGSKRKLNNNGKHPNNQTKKRPRTT
jgi:hypothetical protein